MSEGCCCLSILKPASAAPGVGKCFLWKYYHENGDSNIFTPVRAMCESKGGEGKLHESGEKEQCGRRSPVSVEKAQKHVA